MVGGVHQAGRVPAAWAGFPVVDEIAGGYRLAGDLLPPLFPLFGGPGWLIGGQQVFPAQRAPRVLPGQQPQGVRVERWFHLLAPVVLLPKT
jgi:hypothetical protein